jgi:3'-phosphoadenosine 5'-phosphosulfate sulfotransferase (PAPS reductase)/FAD synthetase
MTPPLTTPTDAALKAYHWWLLNSSGGKDSQAMLDVMVALADSLGVPRYKLVVVHCDLGRMEWAGTRELAEEQARHYGLRFEVVSRPEGDLLDHVLARGRWPSSTTRYCTSDHKRGQVLKLMTRLAGETGRQGGPVRILNCLGLRAQESDARRDCPTCKRRQPAQATCTRCHGTGDHQTFEVDARATNGRRHVDTFLPVHDWTLTQVWDRIRQSGVRHHAAYDLGMSRLSCCFCVFGSKPDLLLAAKHNPELLDAYCAVEAQIGHTFTHKLSVHSLRTLASTSGAQGHPSHVTQ